ncbi:thioesterase family protein [Cohnella sp. AR92]|uniref:acyl-CoA thioesterase n=1 Tax=Cohnella sp. AR92 TaxID=648716 RepID=UPI000F8E6AC7|nr:thioesterase family protein [Cohnella sp. AR92]RUS44540.1 acyl-CoA thioesterase [Cohnella sp. AR92]
MSKWFMHPIRVRYQETDKMAVVYHANYINWFEIGRTEWIRQTGLSFRDIEEKGLMFPVVHLEASYLKPAKYDDWITICVRVTEFTKVRLRFEYKVLLGDHALEGTLREELPEATLLTSGSSLHGWINADWKVVALDKKAPELYALLKGLLE